jgi:hypothetical protein
MPHSRSYRQGPNEEVDLLFFVRCPQPRAERLCRAKHVCRWDTAIPGFNISKAIGDTVHEFGSEIKNISHAAIDWAEDVFHKVVKNITKGEFDHITLPPFNVSLDVDIESIPAASLQFSFEEFELFMQVKTKLADASVFTIPLLDPAISALSGTSIDLGVGTLGVFFTADLILDFDASLDITSGLHIKLDDGVSFMIDLFGHTV